MLTEPKNYIFFSLLVVVSLWCKIGVMLLITLLTFDIYMKMLSKP